MMIVSSLIPGNRNNSDLCKNSSFLISKSVIDCILKQVEVSRLLEHEICAK